MTVLFEVKGIDGGKFIVYKRRAGGYRLVIEDVTENKTATILVTQEQVDSIKANL